MAVIEKCLIFMRESKHFILSFPTACCPRNRHQAAGGACPVSKAQVFVLKPGSSQAAGGEHPVPKAHDAQEARSQGSTPSVESTCACAGPRMVSHLPAATALRSQEWPRTLTSSQSSHSHHVLPEGAEILQRQTSQTCHPKV